METKNRMSLNQIKRKYINEWVLLVDPDDSDEDTQPLWAERQTDYTGIDPLICPNCGKPLTFVGTFFGNWNELKYLFDIAGKDSTIPPALLRAG